MALGKGLSALIPDHVKVSEVSINTNEAPAPALSTNELNVADIHDNRFQPRQNYDEAKLDELAASIREKGLIQPIVVRKAASGYEVVAGERRLKAARKLGLLKVPVVMRDVSDKEALVLALVENVQREELNAIERAETYRRLIDEFKYTQEEVAKSVGKDRVTVTNLVRLLKLPKEIQKGVIDGKISEGHARALLSVEDDSARMILFLEAVHTGFSVRELEKRASAGAAAAGKAGRKGKGKPKDAEVAKLEEELRNILGTRVSVENSRKNKGRLVIEYYSLNDLDRILGVIRK